MPSTRTARPPCTAPLISRSLQPFDCSPQRGAKVEIWNQKNRKGWTPLKITQGVHRGMNIQKSPATEAAVREVMIAAGVEPVVPPGSSTEPSDGKPYEP